MEKYIDIQNEVIKKYRVTIDEFSTCWSRMHVHVRERRICKWHQKNSLKCTFELFHEIGHIENNNSKMRRCEQEYFATVWAVEELKKYGLTVPENIRKLYQDYVNREKDRGIRRHGNGYSEDLTIKWD